MGDKKTNSLSDHHNPYVLANDFGKHCIKKIEKIQLNINDICESGAVETNRIIPDQSSVFFRKIDAL